MFNQFHNNYLGCSCHSWINWKEKVIFLNDKLLKKTIYFLGAGFSSEAKIPVQNRLIYEIFDSTIKDTKYRSYKKKLKKFLEEIYNCNVDDCINKNIGFPDLEDIFSLIDASIETQGHLKRYNFFSLLEINDALSYCLRAIINEKMNVPNYIDDFVDALIQLRLINQERDFFTVITTNWDKVLINSIRKRASEIIDGILSDNRAANINSKYLEPNARNDHRNNRKNIPLIDYCIYTNAFSHDNNHIPSFKIKAMGFANIKIIHLHGTTDWMYCPCCGNMYSPPSHLKTNLLNKKLMNSATCKNCRDTIKNDKDKTKLIPFLIMPTYLKDLSNPHIKDIWRNAAVEIREAERLVIIGYSLPQADFLIRNLLTKNIGENTEIFVVLKHFNAIKREIRIDYDNKLSHVSKKGKEEIINNLYEDYKKKKYIHYKKLFGEKKFPYRNIKFSGTKNFIIQETKNINKKISGN